LTILLVLTDLKVLKGAAALPCLHYTSAVEEHDDDVPRPTPASTNLAFCAHSVRILYLYKWIWTAGENNGDNEKQTINGMPSENWS